MLSIDIFKKLQHFELEVKFKVHNEIIVLFGPSGSGKTTILNTIAGLSHPDHGSIILNNTSFYGDHIKPLPVQKRRIGYLFQDYALFQHMTVEKNIMYGVNKEEKNDTDIVNSIVESLGVGHLLSKYPTQISGGEKQRVALARALATKPKLLLLDEPFSALDNKTRLQCHDQLFMLHRYWQIPIILVTHNLEEAEKLGDRILFIEKGKIIKEKAHSK
ncbi:MAG TPA: ATP-binding cassette domain-containing protein [Bacillota bacterium]|nr:ATP-binding cassette domain-containing protein [Bacillota bacterium]